MDRNVSFRVSRFGRGAERAVEFSPSLLDRRKEKLYVLFVPLPPGPAAEDFYDKLFRIIRKSFYSARGGATRALREAVYAANRLLIGEGVRGNLVCVTLRGEGAYVALSGSGKVLVWDGKGLKEIKGGEPAPGENQFPLLRLDYAPFSPELVLIFLPESLEIGPLKRLKRILGAEGAEGALSLLKSSAQDPDAWSFVLEPVVEKAEEKKPPRLPVPSIPEVKVEEIKDRFAGGASRLGQLAKESLLPEKPPIHSAGKAPPKMPLAKILALSIPLIVIMLIGLAYLQRERAIKSRFNTLLTQAEQYIIQAREAPDDPTRREAFRKASEALDEARLLRPLAPELAELEEKFTRVRDEVYKIERVYKVITLLETGEPGAIFHRLCVEGQDIYVLDRGNDRIYHYRLNEVGDALVNPEAPEVILEKGQISGDSVVEELVDMACYRAPEPEAERGLLVLDVAGHLFKFIPPWGSPRRIALAQGFTHPEFIESYGGRFYVLDTERGQLWRYIPHDNGYGDPPQPYFTNPVDMKGLRDLALDGYVYLLFSDGQIRRFLMGKEQPFHIQGLDKPLEDPAALFTLPEEDLEHPVHPLYVADRANNRVVQLDKTGNFMRQLLPARGRAFEDVQDFTVDEAKKQAFLLTSRGILLVLLP